MTKLTRAGNTPNGDVTLDPPDVGERDLLVPEKANQRGQRHTQHVGRFLGNEHGLLWRDRDGQPVSERADNLAQHAMDVTGQLESAPARSKVLGYPKLTLYERHP